MVDNSYGAFFAELRKARGRVGLTVGSACHWLLRVIQTPVETLSELAVEKLKSEIAAFATYTALQGEVPQMQLTPIYDWHSLLGAGEPSLPSLHQVRSLVAKSRLHVSELMDKGETTFNTIAFPHVLVSRSSTGLMCATGYTGRAEWNFDYALMQLLQRQGHRIQRCSCCARLFYCTRLDKKVCSERCRSKQNMRKRRHTPFERYGVKGRPRTKRS